MGMLLFSITGREFTPAQLRLFEGFWSLGCSFPEPRLWNNRIAALAGSARSTSALGVAGGIAVSEAIVYGYRPLLATMDFLRHCVLRVRAGEDLHVILRGAVGVENGGKSGVGKNRRLASIPGFGRPITSRDERIEALSELAVELGLWNGEHRQMLESVQRILLEMGHELHMNAAALVGALAADQGLSPSEYYHYMISCFMAGMIPCAIDALEKPEGAFFPLRCENIQYQGAASREWLDYQQ
jgi:hypothetical protein